jgi:hypothetical protein
VIILIDKISICRVCHTAVFLLFLTRTRHPRGLFPPLILPLRCAICTCKICRADLTMQQSCGSQFLGIKVQTVLRFAPRCFHHSFQIQPQLSLYSWCACKRKFGCTIFLNVLGGPHHMQLLKLMWIGQLLVLSWGCIWA